MCVCKIDLWDLLLKKVISIFLSDKCELFMGIFTIVRDII